MMQALLTKSRKKFANLLLLLALFAYAPSSQAKTVWIFDTLHRGSGSYRYSVCEDAIRIENTGNGGVTVASAPTWKISCFRPSEKLEFISPLKDFDSSLIMTLVPKRTMMSAAKAKLVQTESLRGLACNKLKLPEGSLYWTPKDLKTAPEASEVVARYFSTANVSPMPVRILRAEMKLSAADMKRQGQKNQKSAVPWLNFKNMERSNDDRLHVDLIAWKKVPYKASDFEYPKGFKRTNDIKDVIISAAYRNDLIDLAKDFTSSADEVSKQKKPGK